MPLLLVRRTHDDVLGPGAVGGQLAHRPAEFEHGAVFVEDALERYMREKPIPRDTPMISGDM